MPAWAATAVVVVLVWLTFAFGGVYPWAWQPALIAVTLIGIVGVLFGRGSSRGLGRLISLWALVIMAIAVQLVPLPSSWLQAVSPQTALLAEQYRLTSAIDAARPLSIAPALTARAMLFVAALAIFVYGFDRIASRQSLFRLTRGILIIGAIISVIGIIQQATPGSPIYGFWRPTALRGAAPFGPFVNRNHFAGWMVMAIALGLGYVQGLLVTDPTAPRRKWRDAVLWWSQDTGTRVILASLAIAVMTLATIWTLSRSGIVSLGLVFLLFVIALQRSRQVAGRVLAMVVGGAALIGGSIVWKGADVIASRFADPNSLESRWAAWVDTAHILRDFPLAGTGLNTYTVASLFYQKSNLEWHLAEAHNDYLQLAAEGGVLVAVPVLLTILVALTAVARNLQASSSDLRTHWLRVGSAIGLAGIAAQELVEFSLQKPANAFLFSILLCMALYEPGRSRPPLEA